MCSYQFGLGEDGLRIIPQGHSFKHRLTLVDICGSTMFHYDAANL